MTSCSSTRGGNSTPSISREHCGGRAWREGAAFHAVQSTCCGHDGVFPTSVSSVRAVEAGAHRCTPPRQHPSLSPAPSHAPPSAEWRHDICCWPSPRPTPPASAHPLRARRPAPPPAPPRAGASRAAAPACTPAAQPAASRSRSRCAAGASQPAPPCVRVVWGRRVCLRAGHSWCLPAEQLRTHGHLSRAAQAHTAPACAAKCVVATLPGARACACMHTHAPVGRGGVDAHHGVPLQAALHRAGLLAPEKRRGRQRRCVDAAILDQLVARQAVVRAALCQQKPAGGARNPPQPVVIVTPPSLGGRPAAAGPHPPART